jgi:hypothetical protein
MINKKGLEMMHLQDFASLLGHANWFEPKMFKEHGAFIQEFREEDLIEKDLAEFYLMAKGAGVLLQGVTNPPVFKPTNCCSTESKLICLTNVKEYRLLKTVTRLSEIQNPVPEIVIWHDVFMQTDNCTLKNDADFRYSLFQLIQLGRLARTKDDSGDSFYYIPKVQVKRGPGRPRKY